MGKRVYAQRCRGTQGEPKRALGWLLGCKEVHFRFAEQIPNLGYCLMVQHPFPRPEFLPRQKIGCKVQNSQNMNRSQGEELVLRPKEKMAFRVHDCEPPWWFMRDTSAMLSFLTITWHLLRRGRKWISARKTALSSRQFMCQERNSVCLWRMRPSLSLMRPS